MAGLTVTEPSTVVPLRGSDIEFRRKMFDSESVLVPAPIALKLKCRRVPAPSTPAIGPFRLSKLKVTDPAVLLIKPALKKVKPPPGRNPPSVTLMALTMAGLK